MPVNSSALLFSSHKDRAYIPSASTALDLLDIYRTDIASSKPLLRFSSRYPLSPIDDATGLLRPRMLDPRKNIPIQDSELAYHDRTIVEWPPNDASQLLNDG